MRLPVIPKMIITSLSFPTFFFSITSNTTPYIHYNSHIIHKQMLPSTSTLLFLFLTLSSLPLSSCRYYTTKLTLPTFRRNDAWTYIDRIHLNPGHMTVRCQVSFTTNKFKEGATYQLELVAIPQSIWQKSLHAKCDEHKLSTDQQTDKKVKEIVYLIDLNHYNSYQTTIVSKLDLNEEETYSFVLRDCSKKITNDGYGRQAKIQINLDVRNNDKHISAGQEVYGWLLPLLLISAAICVYLLFKEKEQEGDNWIKITLKISLLFGFSSILFKYIGYLVYAHGSGYEHGVFDVFYLLLHSISDSVIMVLLMLLAYGWTVTFKNTRDFDLYVPLACMLGLVNIIMTMLNKISDGQHDKYHMYDTIPAYIMIGFRLVGLIVFGVGIGWSWYNLKKDQDKTKVQKYLIHMTILGTIYLAFVPIGFVVVRYVSTRNKKQWMFFSVELVRFAVSYWLAVLASWKKSAYRAIIDKSFMEKGDKFF